MVYIIYKNTDYQDLGNKRIDVGLYYVEEKSLDTPKDYVLFGINCCERFIVDASCGRLFVKSSDI